MNSFERDEHVFKNALAGHPDAPPLLACMTAPLQGNGVVISLGDIAALLENAFSATGSAFARIDRQGYAAVSSGTRLSVIGMIDCRLSGGSDERAREVFSWIFDLASKGRAPHIFPDMVTSVADGHLRVARDTETLEKNSRGLWEGDCEKARQEDGRARETREDAITRSHARAKEALGKPAYKLKFKT